MKTLEKIILAAVIIVLGFITGYLINHLFAWFALITIVYFLGWASHDSANAQLEVNTNYCKHELAYYKKRLKEET